MLRVLFLALLLIAGRPATLYAMPAKLKAVLTCAGYGTVGGALLGTAAMAFGAKPRAVFIGASLGLYAGLIFGAYVVATHSSDGENGGAEEDAASAGRWNPYSAFSEIRPVYETNIFEKQRYETSRPIYLNVINIQF